MDKTPVHSGRKGVYKMIAFQAIATGVIAGIFAITMGKSAGVSSLIGGTICVVANLFFMKQLFAHTGALQAKKILRGLYLGELGKIILTILLFVFAVKWLNVAIMPLVVTYVLVHLLFWFAPLIVK